MPEVRLGVIGVGYIARKSHLPALAALRDAGEVTLQAFCDVSEETLQESARDFGVERVYTDHHEMLEREELDGLFLLIPPTCHTDVELIAAERKLPVLIEKPQTLDLEQARRFERAFRESGSLSQVGFMTRYYPAAEIVKDILAERSPRHASIQLFYSGAPIRYWTSRWELCGGSFVENTIHMVDFLRFLFGDIESVSAFYVERRPEDVPRGEMNLPHAYLVNYRFANGIAANCTTSRCLTDAGVNRREVLLVSESSLIEWSSSRIAENGQVLWEQEGPCDPFALQAAAFVRAIQGEARWLRSPYGEALNTLEAVLGANESASRGGELIRLR